ncbi:MAG: segregation/condensation protein A [Bacillota bacterium]
MTTAYKVTLDIFEGPLDLLLHLIRRDQMNIYDIPIARITDQYLKYLRAMQELDLEIASEFLVMAATLLEIKAKLLLPTGPVELGEEPEEDLDPRQRLVQQLLEYGRFKEVAAELGHRRDVQSRYRSRIANDWARVESDPRLPEGLSIYDLVEAFELLLAGAHEPPPAILEAEQLTVGQKMEEISALLRARGTATFWQLLPHPYTRGQVIVTFLAVLELLRRAGVVARQKSPYGEIMLVFCGAKEELE